MFDTLLWASLTQIPLNSLWCGNRIIHWAAEKYRNIHIKKRVCCIHKLNICCKCKITKYDNWWPGQYSTWHTVPVSLWGILMLCVYKWVLLIRWHTSVYTVCACVCVCVFACVCVCKLWSITPHSEPHGLVTMGLACHCVCVCVCCGAVPAGF